MLPFTFKENLFLSWKYKLTFIGSQQFNFFQVTRIKVRVKKVTSTLEVIHYDRAGSAESQTEKQNQLSHMVHWTKQSNRIRKVFVPLCFVVVVISAVHYIFFLCIFISVSFPIAIIKTIILRHKCIPPHSLSRNVRTGISSHDTKSINCEKKCPSS